jgi:hypothetical protein
MQRAVNTLIRVGRTAALATGLAVMLAVVLGVATAANAAAGDPLRLGKLNAVNQATRLVGGLDGAMLRIDNGSTGPSATALELMVEPGKPPMRVDPAAGTATGLDADELDGKDGSAFFSGKTYTARRDQAGPGGGQEQFLGGSCDPGDKVLGGGGGVSPNPFVQADDGTVTFSRPGSLGSWNVSVQDNGSASNVFVEALCADFPPLR